MKIICLTPLEEGVYNAYERNNISTPPEGWAYIPEDFPLPSTFPRLGSLKAEEMTHTREVEVMGEDGEMHTEEREFTYMTVTAMTEGTLPEPVPEPDPVPTGDGSIWEELDKAYQEGVDSV